jgi:hypothetical protein
LIAYPGMRAVQRRPSYSRGCVNGKYVFTTGKDSIQALDRETGKVVPRKTVPLLLLNLRPETNYGAPVFLIVRTTFF